MTEPLTGFFPTMPEPEYFGHREALSASGMKALLRAPALFKWAAEHQQHKQVFDFGSAVHATILGAGPAVELVDVDDWKTQAARDERDDIRAAGQIPVNRAEYDQVAAIADAVRSHPLAAKLLADGQPEVSAFCLDEATRVPLRCRYDWLADGYAVDVKTTVTADPKSFGRTAHNFGYHIQAAHYLAVARTLGRPLDGFAFVLVEKEPPYLVSVVELDADSLDVGAARTRQAIELFARCTELDSWPGYPDTVTTVTLPRYAFQED